MSEKPEVVPAKGTPKNSIVHPRTELRWPPFHSNLLNEAFLTSVKGVFDEMLGRLYYGADKRKGWATAEPWTELTEHECRICIRDSIAKDKLIDAMNYLMFAHLNGHKILTLRNQSLDSQIRDQLANALGVTGRSWDEILAMVGAVKAQAVGHEKTIEAIAKELKLDPDAPADTIISTVHFLVKRCQSAVTEVSITGCTDPDVMENVAKMIKANGQPAGFAWDGRTKNTVTIKNEAAPDLFPEQRITVKKATVTIDGLDLTTIADEPAIPSALFPEQRIKTKAGAVEELKWPRTTPPEGADKTRKTALPNAMAAPYGVKASKKQQQYELTMEADESGFPSVMFRFKNKKDRDDYLPLLRTFLGALEQAAYGKGRERHANDLPFIEQPILTMAQMLDSDAGLAQQVIKKTIEARSLPSKTARINELRGTLVYAAAMILFEEMYGRADDPDELDEIDL